MQLTELSLKSRMHDRWVSDLSIPISVLWDKLFSPLIFCFFVIVFQKASQQYLLPLYIMSLISPRGRAYFFEIQACIVTCSSSNPVSE